MSRGLPRRPAWGLNGSTIDPEALRGECPKCKTPDVWTDRDGCCVCGFNALPVVELSVVRALEPGWVA